MSIEAMKRVLEALDNNAWAAPRGSELEAAYIALRQAIEQAEKQDADEWYEKALWGAKQEPVVYQCPRCATSIEVDLSAKPLKREQAEKQPHTDHPARHWDRTCPACVAEAEKEEPVAYVNNDGFIVETSLALKEGTKLYTAPPRKEWVGLTDEEVLLTNGNEEYSIIAAPDAELIEFARTIEAKLKEKNRG